jgi:PPM family protein phosphatase
MRFTIYQQSAIGSRKVNQDRVGYSYSRNAMIMVVCDGMGGHAQGEVAAEIAVETICRRFQQEARNRIRDASDFLQSVLSAAHRAIVAHAVERDLLECPRTTAVVCLVQNGRACWAHAGDSRLYLYRGGKLVAQTFDHSKVQQMIDQGLLTEEQAGLHPDRNKVYSCLGGVLPPTINVSSDYDLQIGDNLVLSTDGFWSQIPIIEMGTTLFRRKGDIMGCVPEWIAEAERRAEGTSDNISVVAMTWAEQDGLEKEAGPPSEFTTQTTTTTLTKTQRLAILQDDVTEQDIEAAINEIQNAIKKVSK